MSERDLLATRVSWRSVKALWTTLLLAAACDSPPTHVASVHVAGVPSLPASTPVAKPAASHAVEVEPEPILPTVDYTFYTFVADLGGGLTEHWGATVMATDTSLGLYQYEARDTPLRWFSKDGFRVDKAGIYVVPPTTDRSRSYKKALLVVAFPLVANASIPLPGDYQFTYTVMDRETLTVPAGTFETWRIVVEGGPNRVSGTVWLASGVGIVQAQIPSNERRIAKLVSIQRLRRNNP
jgi:hypothetical protein